MDKYFKTKKTRNEPEFDLDFQRKIDEDLKNFKYEPVERSFRDDLSDYSARKSFARDPLNESVASSKDLEQAFRDLRAANFERDQGLMEYEKDFNMAKMANKGEFVEYDYENMQYKPSTVKNELIAQEKVEEIKRAIQQKVVELPESPEIRKTNGLMRNNLSNFDDGAQLKTEESPRNIQEQERDAAQDLLAQENAEIARRLERAAMSREILQMEKEDARSLNYERLMHQEKFKDRLFCLPESFPVKKEAATRVANMDCTLPRLKFMMPTIPKPISNPKEHLLETSKTEIDKILLNKITNKKKPKMTYQKINEKDKTLLSKSKFDASIANSKASLLNKEKEEKSLINIRRLPSRESQTLVPSRVLSDKTNRLGDSFEKGSSKIPNLAKWILNKSLTLYPKLAKIDQSAVKAAMKEIENFPTYKVFYDQIISAAIDHAPFNELEPNLDNEGMPKSLDTFISRVQQKNLRKLEIKMEELIDIKGVGQLKSLQLLTLPMNKIQDIREISSLKSLIEIDLSQNSIKSMKGLSNLKYLRHLNLEVNQITKIEDLEGCELLEVLNLNNNQISRIEGLKSLKRLKKLYLFRNKITKMDGIEDAVWLEELDLGRNQIKEITNINKLPVLRKLVLYFNQIEKLPQNFSHISLSEIWLNGNKLTEISDLAYFPSLKYLNFQENEIATLTNHSLMFIPNLRGLNLSFNKIGSFGEVYRLIVHFGSLQQIDLGENLFLRGTTETLRAFYESILVTLLPNLMELNGKQITERITLNISSEKPSNDTLYLHPGRLENDAYHIDKLTSSKLNRHQGIFYIQSRQITANVNNGLFYLSKINETSSLQQGEMYILDHKYSYDIHRSAFKYKESLHKIKSFLLNLVHKRRLRKKHFVQNLDKIIKIQANWRGSCVRQVHDFSRKFKLDKYATKIQRRYRIYRETMRRRRILGAIKYEDDLDEFVEVDVDFKEPDYDALKLKIPENFSMKQFVPAMLSQPPQTYNANPGNNYSQNTSASKAPDSIKKQQNVKYKAGEENKEDDDLSVVSASSSQNHRRIKLKATQPNAERQKFVEERDKAMGDWGFKDENSKMAFGLFLKKQQNRREKKKDLTAMERYEKMYGKK